MAPLTSVHAVTVSLPMGDLHRPVPPEGPPVSIVAKGYAAGGGDCGAHVLTREMECLSSRSDRQWQVSEQTWGACDRRAFYLQKTQLGFDTSCR